MVGTLYGDLPTASHLDVAQGNFGSIHDTHAVFYDQAAQFADMYVFTAGRISSCLEL